MTPAEWWWLFDVKRPRDPAIDYAGALNDGIVEELYDFLQEGRKGGKRSGKPGG